VTMIIGSLESEIIADPGYFNMDHKIVFAKVGDPE